MQNDLLTRAGRLEAYASQDPTNAALLHDLATTYHGAGHHEQALEVLDRVQSVGDAASPALDALRGQVLLALGRWDDASDLFAKALQVQPDSAPLLFNLAYAVWASEKDPRRAVSLFERAVGLDGSNLRFRHHLALALEAAGDPDGAIAALEQALAIDPRHLGSLAMLGRLELDAGDFDAAAEFASRCIATHPGQAAGWQLKGQVALFQMDAQSAARSLRQALDLDAADIDTQISLSQATLMLGRPRHARQLLARAIDSEPSNDVALCLLGWACIADNEAQAARKAFTEALRADPGNADAPAGLAVLALSAGDSTECLEHAESALALDAGHVVAKLAKARAQESREHPAEAKALVDDVLKSTPFGPVQTNVAQMLDASRGSEAVRRMHRRFARTASTSPAARSASSPVKFQP